MSGGASVVLQSSERLSAGRCIRRRKGEEERRGDLIRGDGAAWKSRAMSVAVV
jgi:hypothetical protein